MNFTPKYYYVEDSPLLLRGGSSNDRVSDTQSESTFTHCSAYKQRKSGDDWVSWSEWPDHRYTTKSVKKQTNQKVTFLKIHYQTVIIRRLLFPILSL